MSWKPEVFADGGWNTNSLRFATQAEAEQYAADLFRRWTLTSDHRAARSDDPVTYQIVDGVLSRIEVTA
jgi:hypothetical protein